MMWKNVTNDAAKTELKYSGFLNSFFNCLENLGADFHGTKSDFHWIWGLFTVN